MVSIGIDIGTSNTVVAKVDGKGEVAIHKFEDSDLLPSVIHVEETGGNLTVGAAARNFWADPDANPAETFRRWKMSMANQTILATQDWGDGPRPITPELLTTWLVEHVMKSITGGLGGEEVESVVVTVPHGWRREHVEKCLATREAARAARAGGRPLETKVLDRTVDEPVAAAAYALHAVGDASAFTGKDLLIVDIGGGTTDLSLVRIKSPSELVVVDAINNDVGGDYATALLLGKHLEAVAAQTGIGTPSTAEAVLSSLEGEENGWLREAFAAAETGYLHKLSEAFRMAEGRGDLDDRVRGSWGRRVVPISSTVGDALVTTPMSRSEYLARLGPFFESAKELLTRFLSRIGEPGHLPYAVLMTGGGSRIGGLRSQVIEPVIRELTTRSEARSILERLGRLRLNESRLSTAVAMGAALVASGRITIEERLLWDVGLEATVPESMAETLDLDDSRRCIASPLLARGARLPATVGLKDLGFGTLDIEANDLFTQLIVVFDDMRSPYDQTWERSLSGSGDALKNVDVRLTADTEGMLHFTVTGNNGRRLVEVDGKLHRPRRPQAGGILLRDESERPLAPVRTPQQIAEARKASR